MMNATPLKIGGQSGIVLEIVVRQHDDIGGERQNAQPEDISHREGQQKRKIREIDQPIQSEELIGQEISQ
jgi:hypothetical protein